MSKIYAADVVNIAAAEVGYIEKATNKDLDSKNGNPGTSNWTKYARDLWAADPHFYQGPKNGYDWCAVFVDWCVYMAADRDSKRAQASMYYTGPYGAGCGPSVAYYQAAGAWHDRVDNNRLFVSKPGDQIFFGSASAVQHTGLVERVEDGVVYTIEGNSDNMVRRRSYALSNSYILGYGRPGYDGDSKPSYLPFVDVPKDAWYYDAVEWGYENGITKGVDQTHFAPDKPCTRAEVIQMLYKMNLAEGGG